MKDILFPILLMIAGTISIIVFAYESTDIKVMMTFILVLVNVMKNMLLNMAH